MKSGVAVNRPAPATSFSYLAAPAGDPEG